MDQTTKFEVIIVHFIVIFFLFVEYSNFMHNEKKMECTYKDFSIQWYFESKILFDLNIT